MVQKILRTLKHTEDATLQDATPNIYMLCDMALAMASALAKKQQPVKGKGSLLAAASHPGSVPLPSSFYKSLDLQTAGVMQKVMLDASQTLYSTIFALASKVSARVCVCACVRACVCVCVWHNPSAGRRCVYRMAKATKP